ncbi:MAG: helix-turn-helix domain-containing protein [Gemmatimonadales bacterium]
MIDIRDRILAAAARVYAEHGFRGTTTRRVAVAAEVNEVTLFRHFGTKEALITAALSQLESSSVLPPLNQPSDPEAELGAWATALFHHWHGSRRLVCQVMGDMQHHPELAPAVCAEPDCEHSKLTAYLERMRTAGLATADFHSEAAAGLLLGGIFTHAMWREHFETAAIPPVAIVISSFVSLLLNAIGYQPLGVRSPKEQA